MELDIKDTTESKRSASYIPLFLNIDTDGGLCNCHFLLFPSSNIPFDSLFDFNITQLIRYVRACLHKTDCINSSVLLHTHWFDRFMSKNDWNRHYISFTITIEVVDLYNVSVSQLTINVLQGLWSLDTSIVTYIVTDSILFPIDCDILTECKFTWWIKHA